MGNMIKAVQTDNAKEFVTLIPWLSSFGIQQHLSCSHTHPQMSKVERRRRHIVDMVLAMLSQANLLTTFLDYIVMCDKLYVFNYKAFPNLCPYRRGKVDIKFALYVFLGYPATSDGYIFLDPSNRKILLSCNIKFLKQDFTLNQHLWLNGEDPIIALSKSSVSSLPIIVSTSSPTSQSTISWSSQCWIFAKISHFGPR